jgi:signal transduction histidine kinase/DNA-binding response OmpR family regulator
MKGKDDFLLNVSHELRNPMNILLGNLELAIANPKDINMPNYLDNAKASGELLTYMINNMLDAGKLQGKKLELTPMPTNTFTFIERTWSTCKMLLQRKNLEGQVFVEKTIPESLLVDSHRLMQILLNLVSNSAKFTTKGGILMIVSWVKAAEFNESILAKTPDELFKLVFNQYDSDTLASSNDAPEKPKVKCVNFAPIGQNMSTDEELTHNPTISPQKYSNVTVYKTLSCLELMKKYYKLDYNFPRFPNVHHHISSNPADATQQSNDPRSNQPKAGFLKIEIKDTGCGMTEETASHLFKKFSQVENFAVHRQIGTGLGLWITHSLCENMGGGVKAYGESEGGATFVATIKCQPASSVRGKGGKRIQRALVVDDIVTNQRLNKYFLERYGVEVPDIAANGLEAFEIYAKKGNKYFDLIFMDMDMPIKSGADATEKIRHYEKKFNWQPVIVTIITGACTKEECEKFMDPAGNVRANYVFQKPFGMHQCRDLIEQLNNQRTSQLSIGPKSNAAKSVGEMSIKKHSRKLVLIVDDDKFNTQLLSEYLSKQKIETMIACNGKDALEKYKLHYAEIKLMFIDCEMPIMNGYEATKRIRGLIDENIWPDTKIVGLTGNASEECKTKCRKVGMHSVITKPINYDYLQNALDDLFFEDF